jgi:hypothetical protein
MSRLSTDVEYPEAAAEKLQRQEQVPEILLNEV